MAKKALLCGINRYHMPGADLRGCVNDVVNMTDVLVELYGFEVGDISVVTDLDATKANIEAGLEHLVSRATAGDVLYFHFSGHGSNVPDQDGDEADNRDEIYCPSDLDWRNPMRDDWIRELLDTVADGVNVTFVTDCCHSGSITRAIAPPDVVQMNRYLPCPRDIFAVESNRELAGEVRSLRRTRGRAAATVDVKDVDISEILITGCRADQTSADAYLDGEYQGALTHSLVATIRAAAGQLTYRELHSGAVKRLSDTGFDQVPQLEGRSTHFDRPFLEPF